MSEIIVRINNSYNDLAQELTTISEEVSHGIEEASDLLEQENKAYNKVNLNKNEIDYLEEFVSKLITIGGYLQDSIKELKK